MNIKKNLAITLLITTISTQLINSKEIWFTFGSGNPIYVNFAKFVDNKMLQVMPTKFAAKVTSGNTTKIQLNQKDITDLLKANLFIISKNREENLFLKDKLYDIRWLIPFTQPNKWYSEQAKASVRATKDDVLYSLNSNDFGTKLREALNDNKAMGIKIKILRNTTIGSKVVGKNFDVYLYKTDANDKWIPLTPFIGTF